jgi:hypothetical protein
VQDLAKLSDHARYEIEDLMAAGITPTPEEIVELSAIGWQVESPELRRHLSRGVPVCVGGAKLYPLTFEANDWCTRIGVKLGADIRATAYAMAHCYGGSDFPEDLREAKRAVLKWSRKLRCNATELMLCVSEVLSQDEDHPQPPPVEGAHYSTTGEMSARLAAVCGGSPEFWERRCSYKYAMDVLHCVMDMANETGKPLPSDPSIQAIRALGWAVEKIKARHKGGCGNGE